MRSERPLPLKPRLFAILATSKERLHRPIHAHGDVLGDGRMNRFAGGAFRLQRRQFDVLTIQTDARLSFFPCRFAFPQEMGIQPAAFFQLARHDPDLFLGRVQAVFERLTHRIPSTERIPYEGRADQGTGTVSPAGDGPFHPPISQKGAFTAQ